MDEATAHSAFSADDDGDPARPEYARIIEERFSELIPIQQTILRGRVWDGATLDKVAAAAGLTRELVRQIEAQALDKLAGNPPEIAGTLGLFGQLLEFIDALQAFGAEPVRGAVANVAELELPVSASRFIEAGFEPLDSPTTKLLLAVAKRMGAFGRKRARVVRQYGVQWLTAGDSTPERLIYELTQTAHDTGVVGDLVEFWGGIEVKLRTHVGSDREAAELAHDVVDGLGLEEVGGEYAVLGGVGVAEGLARILRANGEPLTRKTLVNYYPGRSERTVSNALLKSPFVRVGPDEFALQEWGATPRPTLRDLVYNEIDLHTQVAVSYLEELAVKHHYSRNSIAFYSALPDVIDDAGVLRRRRKGDPPAVCEPWLDGSCFRVIAGVHRGNWSCAVVVSHRRLYTGPQPIPTPLAEILEIEPGASQVPIAVGGHTVHSSWLHAPYLFGGQLRPVLDELGFADGQHVRLVAVGPKQLLIEPVPTALAFTSDNPFHTLISGAGLYDGKGQPISDGEIGDALSFAVGFDVPAPAHVVERRLTERRNGALREAFALIFREELGL